MGAGTIYSTAPGAMSLMAATLAGRGTANPVERRRGAGEAGRARLGPVRAVLRGLNGIHSWICITKEMPTGLQQQTQPHRGFPADIYYTLGREVIGLLFFLVLTFVDLFFGCCREIKIAKAGTSCVANKNM